MTGLSPTVATVLTAAGRSAVAVVQVAGPGAAAAVDACFHPASGPPISKAKAGLIRFGRWLTADGEEVVVCRRASSVKVAAGKDIVEVHCHGGAAAVQAVMHSLVARGCARKLWTAQPAGPGASRIAAQAAQALRHAPTERTAAVLLDQVEGALQDALKRIDDCVVSSAAARLLDDLLRWSAFGAHLTRPWRVVLAGAPNVGKSSLVNAMLGYRRAIVFDQPGTTRDVVTAAAAMDGWPVTLADTAGLRKPTDATEQAGLTLTRQMLDQADLVIEVRDATNPAPVNLGEPARKLLVCNKIDLAPKAAGEESIATSATTGQGLDRLLTAVGAALVPECPPGGAAVPFSAELVECLRQSRDLAAAGDWPAGRLILQALLAPAETGA